MVGAPMKWLQPWASKPLIHQHKSCDLGITHEYGRIAIC
jgi:hypothetical protein